MDILKYKTTLILFLKVLTTLHLEKHIATNTYHFAYHPNFIVDEVHAVFLNEEPMHLLGLKRVVLFVLSCRVTIVLHVSFKPLKEDDSQLKPAW